MATNGEVPSDVECWADKGIFVYYDFDEKLRATVPKKSAKFSGWCKKCNKKQSSIWGIKSNFVRHLMVIELFAIFQINFFNGSSFLVV